MERQKRWALILAAVLLVFPAACRAELPADLRSIEAEAFMDNTSLRTVTLPVGLEEIGPRAFSGCAGLSRVVIPDTVTALGEDCFAGCAGDLLIVTSKGSAAMDWAQGNNTDFQAGTRYRALLVGQSYRFSSFSELEGPLNDVQDMARCLSRLEGTAYTTVIETDLSADGILSAIQTCFAGTEEQDVSLFYYSGHGWSSSDAAIRGALVAADGKEYVTAAQLRAALDAIPGRKVVIIDACYSGSFVSGGEYSAVARSAKAQPENGAEAFLDAFTAAFSWKSRSSGYSRYFLLTSAAEYEEAYEDDVGGRHMGLFSSSLITGLGWNCRTQTPGAFLADANENGTVTLREAYTYTYSKMVREGQHVQVYPSSCDWMALARQMY